MRCNAAPAWVIRVALRRPHFNCAEHFSVSSLGVSWRFLRDLERLAAPPSRALQRLDVYSAARCGASWSGVSWRFLRDLEHLAAPPSSALRRPLGICFAALHGSPYVFALRRSTCASYSAAHLHYSLSAVQRYLAYLLLRCDGAKLFINVPVGTGVCQIKRKFFAHCGAVRGMYLPC